MRERRDSISVSVAMPMQIVPPKSIRSGPSSRSISTASAWLAPLSRRAAWATASAVSRVISTGVGQPQRVPQFGQIARDDAAAKHGLGARQRRDAGGDLAAGEGLDNRQRAAAVAQRLQDHAFERVVVLGHDEIAEPLPHLGDDRAELALDVASSAPRTVSLVSICG